jgi:hypothetical protein
MVAPDPHLKLTSLINMVVFNGVALILIALIYDDRVFRINYWEGVLGFTPHTIYYPFFYITSAVQGSSYIPGTLTIDWLQVILVVMVVIDGNFALRLLRRRRQERTNSAPPKI